MFKKPRKKKYFPPGTFIPTPARIFAILQLCIAFSVICYNIGTPFLEDVFSVREQQFLYDTVINSEYFSLLDVNEADSVMAGYQELLTHGHRSFGTKMAEAFKRVFIQMPPFKIAWLVLSVVIPILLLKKVEGAKHAVWLLPLLTGCYALDNQLFYESAPIKQEILLFPSEETLVREYLGKPLNSSLSSQQEELTRAWNLYLVDEWANEPLSNDPALFQRQVDKGFFAFNLARIEAKRQDQFIKPHYEWKQSPFWLVLYGIWNVVFAVIVTLSLKPRLLPQ